MTCKRCGTEVIQPRAPGKGRPKEYCGQDCYEAAYDAQRAAWHEKRKARYHALRKATGMPSGEAHRISMSAQQTDAILSGVKNAGEGSA